MFFSFVELIIEQREESAISVIYYNVLVQIRFTTSKTKLVYYNKHDIRVAERPKTSDLRKLGNLREISNLNVDKTAQYQVPPPKIKL